MARAEPLTTHEPALYGEDFSLWVERQARLLREGRLDELDVVNLLDEVESLGISHRHAVASNLVVVLKHLLKCRFQPQRRSKSWLSSIAEHRRQLHRELETSPSLRPYAAVQFERCYQDAVRQAAIETGLGREAFPSEPPFDLDQTLDPDFLPD